MPHDVTEPNEHETGFGTGLRPRLEGRRTPSAREPEPAAEQALEQADKQPESGQSEVEELWTELESALEREAGLRKAVAEYGQLQARAADLEQALAVRESELADLRASLDEETRPQQHETARAYLRRQAEQHADLLWRAFQDGLTALRSDGSLDFRLRLEAARALLAEAYPESAPPERTLTPEQQAAQDELAGLRARRAHHQPS
jgi:chromosome segregation ATPase